MYVLKGAVGREGENIKTDVVYIQRTLNTLKIAGATRPIVEDGLIGPKTIERIELFQKKIVKMLKPDGRIDPHGRSVRELRSRVRSTSTERVASGMKFSTKGANLLRSIEELAVKPYDDQTGKGITKWVKGATIGYGHLIGENEWESYKGGISEDDAAKLFDKDLSPYVKSVNKEVKVSLEQRQFDALVILVFNIGTGGFASSSVLKLINDPSAKTSYNSLEAAWKAWNKSQGKVMKGLNNRRNAEWNIYTKGVYKKW